MANAIKYTTGSETLALKKGNFYIGTGDVGKGPTSTTGYYNGITPPTGGYTVYLNKASGGPSIYTCANDTELISITNSIAGTSYTTANECFTYFTGQSDKMVLNRDYEGIVTDGLVLNLDAGFTPSYSRSGTTWYDVGGSNNGTLTNGPTFDSANGGSIVFDGTNDYVDCGSTVGGGYIDITAEVWTYPTRDENYYFARYGGGSGWIILSYVAGSNRVFGVHGRELGGGVYFANNTATSFPENNRWYHLCYTKQANNWRLYINGALEVNVNVGSGTVPFLAAGLDTLDLGGLTGDTYTQGNVANGRIYNRALSSSEVLQNYNAQKGRFGL